MKRLFEDLKVADKGQGSHFLFDGMNQTKDEQDHGDHAANGRKETADKGYDVQKSHHNIGNEQQQTLIGMEFRILRIRRQKERKDKQNAKVGQNAHEFFFGSHL